MKRCAMRRLCTSVLVFAVCFQLSALIPARAGEADDEEEIARKEKEQRELKDKKVQAEKDAAAAKKAEEAAAKKGPAKPGNATASKGTGATLDDLCKEC